MQSRSSGRSTDLLAAMPAAAAVGAAQAAEAAADIAAAGRLLWVRPPTPTGPQKQAALLAACASSPTRGVLADASGRRRRRPRRCS
eukprot:365424-Chlamydomonas_euryale.AAC.7